MVRIQSGGSGQYDFRLASSSDWNPVDSGTGSYGMSTDGDKIGWRLKDDDSSAIVWKFAKGSNLAEVEYNYGENDISMDFSLTGSITTDYGPTIKEKRDAWVCKHYLFSSFSRSSLRSVETLATKLLHSIARSPLKM